MSEEPKAAPLIPLADLGLAPADAMDTELDSLTKTSDFLPQVRVYGADTNVVKEGKFPLGHLGLYHSSEKIIDLGKECDVLNFAARPRATILADTPVSYYDYNSAEFATVLGKAKQGKRGYLAGLEYLLWIPSVESYGLFLMGNKTLRRESAVMKSFIGEATILVCGLCRSTEYTWHGAKCLPCSTPHALPDREGMLKVIEDFKNPVGSDQKLAKEDDNPSGRER